MRIVFPLSICVSIQVGAQGRNIKFIRQDSGAKATKHSFDGWHEKNVGRKEH